MHGSQRDLTECRLSDLDPGLTEHFRPWTRAFLVGARGISHVTWRNRVLANHIASSGSRGRSEVNGQDVAAGRRSVDRIGDWEVGKWGRDSFCDDSFAGRYGFPQGQIAGQFVKSYPLAPRSWSWAQRQWDWEGGSFLLFPLGAWTYHSRNVSVKEK